MRNNGLRIAFLAVIFICGVFLFSGLQNQHVTDSVEELASPTLPTLCIDLDGNKVNRMSACSAEMDTTQMRKGLIPITTNRKFAVSYKAYDNKIISVSYEVTAPDSGKVVENAKIGGFTEDGEYMTAEVSLSEPILMNREYPVRFKMETGTGTYYYYASLIQRTEVPVDRYVQFVYDFYETCTNKDGAGDLNTYLEYDATISNTSYTNVNIQSSLDQVTWGTLSPQIVRKAIPVIHEINEQTCSITADYLIGAYNDDGEQEIYHVHEFYRLRYYNGAMNLLDFERTALEVYDPSLSMLSADGVELGIAERDVQWESNTASDIVAFVQDGALWEFSEASEKLTKVYSLRDVSDGTDERDDNDEYDIRIIRVDESGDIDFVVCGYMNRGPHEGRVGISVCHYENSRTGVRERCFIPVSKSFDYLRADLEKLSYINTQGVYFAYLDGSVCRFDPETGSAEALVSEVDPDCLTASDDGSVVAWMEDMDPDASTSILLTNLDAESTRRIEAASGTYVRALGFLNDDILYGIAKEDDIAVQPAGDTLFAMEELRIETFEGTLVKDYNPRSMWVKGVVMKGSLVELLRVRKNADGEYEAADSDNIMNNKADGDSSIEVQTDYNSRQGTTVKLVFPLAVSNLSPIEGSFTLVNGDDSVIIEPIQGSSPYVQFLVFGDGQLQDGVTGAGEAVSLAYEHLGTVLDTDGAYVYERGNIDERTELDNEDIPSAFFNRELNAERLQSALGDEGTVLNLSGATLDEVIYLVGQGSAVAARKADGTTALIVGFDRFNTLQYDFTTGDHFYVAMDESREDFEAGGNVFVSYLLPQATIRGE